MIWVVDHNRNVKPEEELAGIAENPVALLYIELKAIQHVLSGMGRNKLQPQEEANALPIELLSPLQ